MAPRPRPAPSAGSPAGRSEEIAARRLRALEETLSVRRRPGAPYPLLEVRNPVHRTSYLVMLPEFPAEEPVLCTCTDFARRGLGECKHTAAAYDWLSQHPEAVAPAPDEGREGRVDRLWAEVDRRTGARPRDASAPRDLARPGAALFEAGLWREDGGGRP